MSRHAVRDEVEQPINAPWRIVVPTHDVANAVAEDVRPRTHLPVGLGRLLLLDRGTEVPLRFGEIVRLEGERRRPRGEFESERAE